MARRCLPLWILFCLGLSACTVIRYPSRWDGGTRLPIFRAPPVAAATKTPPSTRSAPPLPLESYRAGDTTPLLEYARALVGTSGPLEVGDRRFPFDCSGFVCAVYYQNGEELMPTYGVRAETVVSGTEIIYKQMEARGEVFQKNGQPGDVVFFDNTWDRDGNGQVDDPFTHIGIIEKVLPDGTLEILHLGNSGIGRIHMNLERPDEYRDDLTGEVLNHKLRRRGGKDPEGTPYLTAQLFRAFGRLEEPARPIRTGRASRP